MIHSNLLLKASFLLVFFFSLQLVNAQLAGTWQHTETGEQIRFENQVYQNYDHIGYYVNVGNKGHSFYVGEDIVYLTTIGNNQYSGYTKQKWSMDQVEWKADTWTVSGNTAYSTFTNNWQKINTSAAFYPNIAGTWYQNGDPSQPCYVQQNGQYLSFQVGQNQSQGYFTSDRELYASSWNAAATLSNDYGTISWGNQNWTKSVTTGNTRYPNIAGTWYQNGVASQVASINQNGQNLSFSLGTYSSQGYFTSVQEIFASDWNTTASLSADGSTLTWGNQSWTRNPGTTPNPGPTTSSGISSGYNYKISAKHSGKVLDVYGGYKSDKANVYQFDWHGGDNQIWLLELQNDGYYKITSKNSGKVLDVKDASNSNSANIYQYYWHGADCQRWRIESLNNGYYKVSAKHSGKVFDIEGASTSNSANLKQYDWHGGDNQQWKFELIGGSGSTSTGSANAIETVRVQGAAREKVYSANVLQSGRSYTLQISGTFSVWSKTDPTGVDALYCYPPKRPKPILWSSLHIDDRALSEYIKDVNGNIDYNPNHTYQVTMTGKGAKLGFGIKDGGAYGGSDNSGEVLVKIIAN